MKKLTIISIAVAAAVSLVFVGEALAQATSDVLSVNYGGVFTTVFVLENLDGSETVADSGGPFSPLLPIPGYVTILEPVGDPDNQGVSDYLVSYTGSSLQLYSDGSPGFPPNLSGLNNLGTITETGVEPPWQPVGQYFGVPSNDILVASDIPEPSTFVLLSLGALGLLAYARRPRK